MYREEMIDRLAAAGSVPLGCLTEEEMAAVGADERTPFRPARHPARLRGLSEETRRAVLATALRGLIARGLLEPPGGPDRAAAEPERGHLPDGTLSLRPLDELDTILGVRRAPAAVVFAGRRSFLVTLHGFREERLTGAAPGISGFLEERVDEFGMHHFTVRTTQNAIEVLAALADPSGDASAAPPADGVSDGVSDIPEEARRAMRDFGPGVTRLDAYHSRPAGTRRIQACLLVRPGEAYVLWSAFGVEPEQPRLSGVTADGLRQVVRDALCDPGGDPPGGEATTWEGRVASSCGPPFRCPVCGYAGLDEPPRTPESGPSYEICPSCGFEFGVTDDDRGFSYTGWRQEWIADGTRWWSRAHREPPGWDPDAQLRALLESGPGDEC